jgi:hypothetical protein
MKVGASLFPILLVMPLTACMDESIQLVVGPNKAHAATVGLGVYSAGDYAQHIRQLKTTVPKEFTIVVQAPFVVIGDEAASVVRRRAKNTVGWAVRRLKERFFKNGPNKIINIWLLKNKQSYEKQTRRLFGEAPGTPFGFYSQSSRTMVMNIATGGGTLVHEIVHPFVEANFPSSPPWFNEGLGSLYEQSAERKGVIVGLTNWRLAGLQKAIRAGRVPSFKTLMAQNTTQFYNQDPGTNYSQSRYLLFYLQQRGLLPQYYRRFVKNQRHDPSGYKSLKSILKENDMKTFQTKWEAFVLRLSFP